MPTVGDTAQRDVQSTSATRKPHIGAVAQTRPTQRELDKLTRKLTTKVVRPQEARK